MKEKTLIYNFRVKHLPGKRNPADYLSRYPALKSAPEAADEDLAAHIEDATIAAITDIIHEECVALKEGDLQAIAAQDQTYQRLLSKVKHNSWLAGKAQESPDMKPYHSIRDRLSISDNLVIYTYDQGPTRVVVPEALRKKVAANLHAGHQGLDSMQRRARHTVYWPGIDGDLAHCRSSCTPCNTNAPSQPAETLIMTPPPEYPFQKTAADICHIKGTNYMVYADRLTGWIEIAHLQGDTTSSKLIRFFRTYFTRYGAPMEISIDGGTNLNSEEMRKFFESWGVSTRISSAYFAQSNGRAEAAVKTAKRVLMDNTGPGGTLNTDKVAVALLQYYNTPLRDVNKSPAQLATGRQLRDGIPTDVRHYKINNSWKRTLRDREAKMSEAHQHTVDKRQNHRILTPIEVGKRVYIQNQANKKWDRSGTITEAPKYRQYTVKMDGSGRLSKRNRRHLKVIHEDHSNTNSGTSNPTVVVHQQVPRTTRKRRPTERYAP